MYHYKALVRTELEDFSGLIESLSEEEWTRPGLCEGWQARDVVGHLVIGYSEPASKVLWIVGTRYGFILGKASKEESIKTALSGAGRSVLQEF